MQMALKVGHITIFARVGLQKLQEDARSTHYNYRTTNMYIVITSVEQ